MANFTIRVELHNATGDDYDLLHKLMAGVGCNREISGSDSAGNPGVWALPTAEYDLADGSRSVAEVRDLVKNLADRVKQGSWVLVTEVKSRSWTTRKLRSGA